MHLMADALERIRTHSYAFLCIRVQVRHEDPLQLGVLGGLLVGAAHLLGDVADDTVEEEGDGESDEDLDGM
jgi:hypothetical protein